MYHFYYLRAVLVLLSVLMTALPLQADSGKTIRTAGPSWENFTNEDGSGLYHEIIREVFAGYEVQHLYVSTVQANSMVAIGRADIKMCETKEIDSLILARLPMYENDFYALFLWEVIGKWEGIQSLNGKKVVWRKGYYSELDFDVPVKFTEVRSGESALKMVRYGRADFYVDDINLIKHSFQSAGETFNPEIYGVEKVGSREYFPVFANTPRGRNLREYYEQEMLRLYKQGSLQEIYKRWNFNIPNFELRKSGN